MNLSIAIAAADTRGGCNSGSVGVVGGGGGFGGDITDVERRGKEIQGLLLLLFETDRNLTQRRFRYRGKEDFIYSFWTEKEGKGQRNRRFQSFSFLGFLLHLKQFCSKEEEPG
ncbi:hypothetical protein NE237_019369 [Protea cynaroides]|uniref:Uncharacterized protein n=1 Tax=Protea cynaroides TaxID=273540 RepID=A0A9Q0KBR8_9MAGN|nr:hypothetical protein NE237_019369 [Protea cynaroides]